MLAVALARRGQAVLRLGCLQPGAAPLRKAHVSASRVAGLGLAGASLLALSVKRPACCEAAPSDAPSANIDYGLKENGTYGPRSAAEVAVQQEKNEQLRKAGDAGELPTIALEEFLKHTDETSLWVAYNGAVFDITDFIKEHPGGAPAILGAGGQDIEAMWDRYTIHYRKDVMVQLEPYRIGTLSEADSQKLRDPSNQESAAASRPISGGVQEVPSHVQPLSARRDASRSLQRVLALWGMTMTASFWWLLRSSIRLLGFFPLAGPLLANGLACLLPCSVPGYGGAAQLPPVDPVTGKKTKVAVVGGGIAGCSCAFSLSEAGYDVTVYESREVLGGNAQCAKFPCGDGKTVQQDLSVVFWAAEYYRNYSRLVRHLGLDIENVETPYVIHTNVRGFSEFYTQPGGASGLAEKLQPSLEQRYSEDLRRYDRMVGCVRSFNTFFAWGSSRTSFYGVNSYSMLGYCNPMNYIGLKTCATKLFGLSEGFYKDIMCPFHGLSMTTVCIDGIPATALPIMDDIMPLHHTRKIQTWGQGNSQEVFRRATAKCAVKLDTRVRQIQFPKGRGWQQTLIDDKGGVETFDRVVMACPAQAAASIIRPTNWIERSIFGGVTYHDEFNNFEWKDWLECPVHQELSCLPEKHRDILQEYGGYLIDIDKDGREGGGMNVEFTHNLGAWSPSARHAGVSGKEARMFMSQCLHKDRDYSASTIRTFSAPRGHPDLTTSNMVATQMLHLIQGRRGVYYCSNWTSPGNGHDLACTSGLVAASALGAPYPFQDDEARRDWRDCRRFMNL